MPGTADNPVKLDPFRTIIEVGWNSVTHVAFRVLVGYQFENNASQNYPPMPDEPPPNSDPDWVSVILNEGTLTFGVGYLPAGWSKQPYARRANNDWRSISEDDLAIDGGLPEFSQTTTYGVLEHGNSELFPPPFQDLWILTPGGAGAGLSIPGLPLHPFDSDTSPRASLEDNMVLLEAPHWATRPGLAIDFGARAKHQVTSIIDKAYPAGSLVARYKGKAYRGCATAVYAAGGPLPKELWILCERSTADD